MDLEISLNLFDTIVNIQTIEGLETSTTDIVENLFVPAMRAHGYSNADLLRAFNRMAGRLERIIEEEKPPVQIVKVPVQEKMIIAFQDEHGNPLLDTDNITPVEVSLDYDDFIYLLNQATEEGLPFDKFINKVISEQLEIMIEEKDAREGGCD